jgi:serine/threonine-protein kinase
MLDPILLDALLLRYEELGEEGASVSPEELCRPCPEYLEELKRRIHALHLMNARLEDSGSDEVVSDTPPPELCDPDNDQAISNEALSAGTHLRVVRFHACGGLGEVHVARDEGLHREVALKRLQRLHAGNPQSRSRFLREAEITSRLEHPGIVPVLAAGQDPDGRPFYAMRLIRGETLGEAIARFHASDRPGRDPGEHQMALRQLLTRVVAVCNTIAYAHSRGILHRDIKPANILLGPYGETLVVDWGLAREIGSAEHETMDGDRRAEASPLILTQPGSVVGTPAYMSPEQATGNWDAVGVSSDIYSLGATLYTVLTGEPPFQGEPCVAFLEKVRHGEFEPPRRRKRDIPRSLEAICLRAMARQPKDRYVSVLDLAADLEHWMADEPVSAYRDPWTIRSARWVKNHKPLAAAAIAVLLTAVAALSISTVLIGRHQAETALQKQKAETQRDLAEKYLDLAQRAVDDYTKVAEDEELKKGDFEPIRKKLLAVAVPFYTDLTRQQDDDPRFQSKRGLAYYHLARVRAEMGESKEAIADYEQMQTLFRQLSRDYPGVPEYRQEMVRALNNLALLYQEIGRVGDAEAAHVEVLDIQQQLAREYPDNPEYERKLSFGYLNRAILYQNTGRVTKAEAAYRKALEIQLALAEKYPAMAGYQDDLAATHTNMGNLFNDRGQRIEAEEAYRQAVIIEEKLAREHPRIPGYRHVQAKAQYNLAKLYLAADQTTQAEDWSSRAQALLEDLTREHSRVPEYRRDLAEVYHHLANYHYGAGRKTQAEDFCRKALDIEEKLVQDFPLIFAYRQDLAISYQMLALIHQVSGRSTEAEKSFRQALAIQEQLVQEQPAIREYAHDLAFCQSNLGTLLRDGGNLGAALELFDQAIRCVESQIKRERPSVSALQTLGRALAERAGVLNQMKRYADALKDWDRALELGEAGKRDPLRWHRAITLGYLGEHARATEEADALLRENANGAGFLYSGACVYSVSLPAARGDSRLTAAKRGELAECYAVRALKLLEQARAEGYFQKPGYLDNLKKDPDLEPLRSREDFKRLLAAL